LVNSDSGKNAVLRNFFQNRRDFAAYPPIEKPETRHGKITRDHVVFARARAWDFSRQARVNSPERGFPFIQPNATQVT
jgi:hypothetical protein